MFNAEMYKKLTDGRSLTEDEIRQRVVQCGGEIGNVKKLEASAVGNNGIGLRRITKVLEIYHPGQRWTNAPAECVVLSEEIDQI